MWLCHRLTADWSRSCDGRDAGDHHMLPRRRLFPRRIGAVRLTPNPTPTTWETVTLTGGGCYMRSRLLACCWTREEPRRCPDVAHCCHRLLRACVGARCGHPPGLDSLRVAKCSRTAQRSATRCARGGGPERSRRHICSRVDCAHRRCLPKRLRHTSVWILRSAARATGSRLSSARSGIGVASRKGSSPNCPECIGTPFRISNAA